MLRVYLWVVSSLYRVALVAVATGVILTAIGMWSGAATASILATVLTFGFGAAAFQIRNSGAALNYPGVDRFFQRVPCYLSIVDKNLRIIRTNKLFRKDFGHALGDHCYRVYKNSSEPCDNCPVIRTFEDGVTHSTETSAITKDGRTVQMIVYTTPVKDEQGNIIGVMEMSTNITELKQLQDQITAEQNRFQDLFEGVPCHISVQDKDLNLIDQNERFKQDFGDHLGRKCYEIYKQRGDACPDCPVLRTFEDGQVHRREETVAGRDGNITHMLVHSSPIFDENGDLIAVMEMSTDITKVKQLQRELTHMGRTIAVMAHRIKNILMGLQGGIFVVNTGLETENRETLLKGWTMIERNVDKVSRIVKDLLYCSKDREMQFADANPTEVLNTIYELYSDRATNDRIDLRKEINGSLPDGHFDAEAVESMLSNLITNAMDACRNDATEGKDHHEIIIRARMRDENTYIFEVADNGPGIPGQVGESVFDDFFTTKGREGTGLGLLVANKVAEEHNGSITFISEEGKGTTFKAIIPRYHWRPGEN